MKPKYQLIMTSAFKRDLKKLKKRGYDLSLMNSVITKLQYGETLDIKYKDHALKGDKLGFRDCHILPDWILLYQIFEDKLILSLSRTGTHSDLLE